MDSICCHGFHNSNKRSFFGHVIGDSLIGVLRERLALSYMEVFWIWGLVICYLL